MAEIYGFLYSNIEVTTSDVVCRLCSLAASSLLFSFIVLHTPVIFVPPSQRITELCREREAQVDSTAAVPGGHSQEPPQSLALQLADSKAKLRRLKQQLWVWFSLCPPVWGRKTPQRIIKKQKSNKGFCVYRTHFTILQSTQKQSLSYHHKDERKSSFF